jgi:hypothetical protein
MSTTPTLEAAATSAAPRPAARGYRLVVLLLVVALAASIAVTIYLAATRPSSASDSVAPAPVPTGPVDTCFRPAVAC